MTAPDHFAEAELNILRRRGPSTYALCDSGAEALDRLGGEIEPTPMAVLFGINMPDMEGLQLLVEIKQRFPDLPVNLFLPSVN